MDNLMIYSLLGLVVMNAVLWIWMLFKSKSDEDIIRIIGKALKKGEKQKGHMIDIMRFYPSEKVIYLPDTVSVKAFVEKTLMFYRKIEVLCEHLGIKIEIKRQQPEQYIVVKKGKKA